jgi:hypothetical protein
VTVLRVPYHLDEYLPDLAGAAIESQLSDVLVNL